MKVYRLDDIPVIYSQLESLKLRELIDASIEPHGNWQGISLGELLSIWLCYILSEGDHRLSPVESWVESNLPWLQTMSSLPHLSSKDFTDDRLESVLDYLSKDKHWLAFEELFSAQSLSIYDLGDIGTVRLDAAPIQGYHQIKEGGLFQKGYSKQHANIGQFKVMLATLDNVYNNFAYPLFHKVFSGEKADDILYLPVLKECVELFASIGQSDPKLVVGDSKMGSKSLRSYIKKSGHYYLVPLSKVQLSQDKRKELILSQNQQDYQSVYKEDEQGNQILVCQGFELSQQVKYQEDLTEEIHDWEERLIFVLSSSYSKSQCARFDKKLESTKTELLELTNAKQGKKIISSRKDLDQRIEEILIQRGLVDCLEISVDETIEVRHRRKYKDRPAFDEEIVSYQLTVEEKKQTIEEKKKLLGWQVYACNAPNEKISLEQCVWKYRGQNKIENRFDNLRNKVAPLVAIYLQKDNRVVGLVNLLMIALKTCSLMEYGAAKKLKENDDELTKVYPGNPKRGTKRPTAKRMLNAFVGISIVVLKASNAESVQIAMTDINDVQTKIIDLIGLKSNLYDEIAHKMQIAFST